MDNHWSVSSDSFSHFFDLYDLSLLILKDIIAFSNCSGGKMIIGIEDTTKKVWGIGDQDPFRLSDSISTMISDSCTPQIEPDIFPQTIEGKVVLVIDVFPGKYRPYYLKTKGKETSSYIRINGTSRPVEGRKLQELELEGQKISYDSLQSIGDEYDEEVAKKLCRTMKQKAIESCETEEEKKHVRDMTIAKLEDMGILCKMGKQLYPTNAYMLLTNNSSKQAKIQCALFKGTVRDIFIDKKTFDGSIYEQIEDAYQFVLKHINLGAAIEGLVRRDVYELPTQAIREMIVNAVTHRSYIDDSCIQISVFDDRVEVLSPGMLYDGLDLEDAKSGKSKCRNKAIAEAFVYMHIIEEWGTGIPRILNRCIEYGLEEPRFEEFGDGIRVTIYRKYKNADIGSVKTDIESPKLDIESPKLDIESPKLDIESPKLDIESPKLDIGSSEIDIKYFENILMSKKVTGKKYHNILKFYSEIGENGIFSRKDVIIVLDCGESTASALIAEMKQLKLIQKVTGRGKGKYKFAGFTF